MSKAMRAAELRGAPIPIAFPCRRCRGRCAARPYYSHLLPTNQGLKLMLVMQGWLDGDVWTWTVTTMTALPEM